jgi:segregation and condensation protein A
VSSQPLNFQLETYEGPLDLLLDLIRRNQVNIYDIPIAQITSQYMEYMAKAAALDMELSSDFIYMAATLIHIKSKMLLPKDPELEKISPEEDPRQELVERLVEHQKYKDAAEMLQQKRMLEEAAWSNPQIRQFLTEDEVLNPGLDVSLFDLVKTFQAVLERAKNRPIFEVGREDVNVPDMIRFLRDTLLRAPRNQAISVTELLERQRSPRAMLCLFLAILELVKRQAIHLQQKEAFADILLAPAENFEEALGSEEAIAAAEQEYD